MAMLYLEQFWDLSTERQVGMAVGPIPLSRAYEAAARLGLDEDNTATLVRAVRELDREYLKHVNKAKEKQ